MNKKKDPSLTKDLALKMYTSMVQMNEMDRVLNDAQQAGRISFYLTHYGEEAAQIGSIAALSPDDLVYAQFGVEWVLESEKVVWL